MEFEDLSQYYDYLENDIELLHIDLNTYKFISNLRDRITDENEKKFCTYELFFTDYSIKKGVLVPKYEAGGNSYPALEQFDDDFQYLISRAENSKNPKYRSKYNHLLWLSPKQHIVYAKEAINSYFSFLKSSPVSSDNNLQSRSFAKYFENLFILSQSINYRKVDAIEYLISQLELDQLNDFTKYSLMKFIVSNGRKLETDVIQSFFEYSKEKLEGLDSRTLESYLKLLITLCQKLRISPNEFHEKLGDLHITQLDSEKEKSFIAHQYYTSALEEYKKANNREKIEKTAVLLEQSKKFVDLKKVSVEIKDEKINEALDQYWSFLKSKVEQLVKNYDPETIYSYLLAEGFLPKAEKLFEETRPTTMDLVSTMVFDINKNINKSKSGGLNHYSLQIKNFTIHQIWLVFYEGIKSGKISFDSLMNYLRNQSWYGNDFTRIDANKEKQGFDWIELLSPSIQNFFVQTEIDLSTKKHHAEGYILSIDSLVLKFEGLLREFSRMIGAQTIELEKRGNGTIERIDFDKLLDNEKLRAVIPEDDIAYFKYLFTSRGMNLRNNVAHSFFNTKNYTSAIMLLLIVALLRLGNFELKAGEDSEE